MAARSKWDMEVARAADRFLADAPKRASAKAVEVQARYEAAYWNTSRSYLPAYVQSARADIDSASRQEILRRVRYFEKNSNVMQKALSILSVNVVGTGINPSPATSKSDWNKSALNWWNQWSEAADISGTSNIPQLQAIVFRAQDVDGDHGLELLLNEFGRPALNLIEAHRITSAGIDQKKLTDAGYTIVDGVIIGPNGRPLAYTVSNDFDGKSVAVIPAEKFVFFYTKRRAGQYRGISLFHGGILPLHDLDDLQKFEMLAAKDAASRSMIVQTAAGGATMEGGAIGRSLTAQPGVTPGQKAEFYKKALGGETVHTYPGDKVEQFQSTRPSAATSGFWDKLENTFVQGSGLSYASLVDYRGNWGGATLRAAVTSDNRLFTLRTNEQARKWQRVWEFAIGWAMDAGELPKNPEFRNVRWHPPRRTTVDIGHESDAMLNELKAGLRTFEGIYGEQGDDWRERLTQKANEAKFVDDLAKSIGVDRAFIVSFAQERLAGIAPDQATNPDGTLAKLPAPEKPTPGA